MENVDLSFLQQQQRQIIDKLALQDHHLLTMRDDIKVLSAMAVRQDNATKSLTDLLQRVYERLASIDEKLSGHPTRT